MQTTVVAGGTDGIGKALALDRLARGGQVAVIGRDRAKGSEFLAEAAEMGAADRACFLPADLSLVAEARGAVEQLRSRYAVVDAVVLCARHYRSTRLVTQEGFEHTFALYYLSRFVFSHEMTDLLDAAERPVILNVAGPGDGGVGGGRTDGDRIRWDDLQSESDYHGSRAQAQGGRLNDLLGAGFAHRRQSVRTRYVLAHPGTVSTAFSGDYDAADAAEVAAVRAAAKPVGEALPPLLEVLDDPPAEPLTALLEGRRLDVQGPEFDPEEAQRLFDETTLLLGRLVRAAPGVSRDRLRRLLDSRVFATVATLQPDGGPHQSVVWMDRDGDDVLFSIAVGSRKERNLRRDPRLSVLVGPPDQPYTYAAIQGTATLSTQGAHELRDRLSLKYTGQTYAEHNPDAAARYGQVPLTVVRVTPGRIIGRL